MLAFTCITTINFSFHNLHSASVVPIVRYVVGNKGASKGAWD